MNAKFVELEYVGSMVGSRLYDYCQALKTKLNSVVWVRERPIQTERPPLLGEVSANFLRIEGATWSAQRIPTAVFSEPLLFLSSNSSVVLTRLSGPQFQTHYFSENLAAPGIELETSGSVARNSGH
jgi:hypothetical protein